MKELETILTNNGGGGQILSATNDDNPIVIPTIDAVNRIVAESATTFSVSSGTLTIEGAVSGGSQAINTIDIKDKQTERTKTLNLNDYRVYGVTTNSPWVFQYNSYDRYLPDIITIKGGLQYIDKIPKVTCYDLRNMTFAPGTFYRITDYDCGLSEPYKENHGIETAQHPFDIIVLALTPTELSEWALATQHEGDTYFANSDLSKWVLKFDLYNTKGKWMPPIGYFNHYGEEVTYNDIMNETNVIYEYALFEDEVEWEGDIMEVYVQNNGGHQYLVYSDPETLYDYDTIEDYLENSGSVIVLDSQGNSYVNDNEVTVVIDYDYQNDLKVCGFKDNTYTSGSIYYMKDEYGNEAPYDFKNIKFHKGLCNATGITSSSISYVYTFYDTENDADASVEGFRVNNKIGENYHYYYDLYNDEPDPSDETERKICLNYSCFVTAPPQSPESVHPYNSTVFNNTIGQDCYRIGICGGCANLRIGNDVHNIKTRFDPDSRNFSKVEIGDGCYGLTFNSSVENTVIGNECHSLTFNASIQRTVIGPGNTSLTFTALSYVTLLPYTFNGHTFSSSLYRKILYSNNTPLLQIDN